MENLPTPPDLNPDDIKSMIYESIYYFKQLSEFKNFMQYLDDPDILISFLMKLKNNLANSDISAGELARWFWFTLDYQYLFPRLFISLIIAFVSKKDEYIRIVFDMIPSLAVSAKNILLRHVAVVCGEEKFSDSPFLLVNHKEMIKQMPNFVVNHPDHLSQAIEFLYFNIKVSQTEELTKYVEEFLDTRDQYQGESYEAYFQIGITLIERLINNNLLKPSLLCELIPQILEFIQHGLPKKEKSAIIEPKNLSDKVYESLKKFSLKCCRGFNDSSKAYDFITQTEFAPEMAPEITKIAIEHNSIDILKKCAIQWPIEDVFLLILGFCLKKNIELFTGIVPEIPKGSKVPIQFLSQIDPNTSPYLIRNFLKSELSDRNKSGSEAAITKYLIAVHKFPKEFYEIVFAEPFVFQQPDMINFVTQGSLRSGVSPLVVLDFIRRTKPEINTFWLQCTVLDYIKDENVYNGFADELIQKLTERNPSFQRLNDLKLKVLMSHFSKQNVRESLLQHLLEKCNTKELLIHFCFLAKQNGSMDLELIGMKKMLSLDKAVPSFVEQFRIYISALNLMIELGIDCDIASIIENAIKLLQSTKNEKFPLLTPNQIEHFKTFLKKLQNVEKFGNLANKIDEIRKLIDQE
ncbi:hypothetical protein GPJ56_008975 [Histomonas meleagridis]|uniref:uncharacterized protein n=1 Tax=Histomonas meleagridis TaxID=135588 RepID=UPI0035596AE7|nr:hypothetical protein GPJ56_008975 [Histomonas meleagridis]KAH0805669.1 hypothetical protein GO595_001510 [Histomonas meleagridis]